jgi:hypothetical protein
VGVGRGEGECLIGGVGLGWWGGGVMEQRRCAPGQNKFFTVREGGGGWGWGASPESINILFFGGGGTEAPYYKKK